MSGHEPEVAEKRRVEVDEEPEAQVLSERELMLLVAPDAAPQDLPAPEPDEAGDEAD
jgi:hypothetical protein